MTPPTKLIFREWKKPEVTFALHGWSWQKGLAFVEHDGRRQVIELVLPGLLAQGGVAFPGIAPTTITETYLLPPPCRTTAEEAACLRAAAAEAHSPRRATKSRNASDLPNWEFVWLRHRHEILLPTPEDLPEFEKRLEVSMPRWRQEYEARKRELEDWRTKTIGQMIYLGGGRYYRELRDCKPASMPERIERHLRLLETTYTRPLREFLGRLHGGYLNWTGEVAKHEPIIRDPVLRERWAGENGLKLDEISADKEAFLSWYRAHCQTPMRPASNDFLDVVFPGARAAIADDALCAEVRFVADFADGSRVWLADCPRRDPILTAEEQQPLGAPVTSRHPGRLGSVNDDHGKLLTKLDSVEKKTDKVLSGVQTLTELAGEQATARDKWRENPLGSRESVADYLLTMDAMKIERGIAAALVRFGYGDSQEQCAETAGVSVATIKRALVKARQTPYANFFARNRAQKIKARGAMKKPDELYARLMQLAAKDPDELRAVTEQMIAKAQGESDGGNAWDKTVQGLS